MVHYSTPVTATNGARITTARVDGIVIAQVATKAGRFAVRQTTDEFTGQWHTVTRTGASEFVRAIADTLA